MPRLPVCLSQDTVKSGYTRQALLGNPNARRIQSPIMTLNFKSRMHFFWRRSLDGQDCFHCTMVITSRTTLGEIIALRAMSSIMSYSPALLLSNDLWAYILSLLAGEVRADIVAGSWNLPNRCREMHIVYSTVYGWCVKGFRGVFKNNPRLSACVFLDTAFSTEAPMSLLGQLQRGNTKVEVLVAVCGTPYVEATLAAGIVAANKPLLGLKAAILHSPTAPAATMLASCMNLTTCCLGHQDDLDLKPLQALPSLSDLRLHQVSSVWGVESLAHLTHLNLGWTDVECAGQAAFLPGLKMLSVRHILVEDLHDDGISACSGLRHLLLEDCCISAATDSYILDIDASDRDEHS